MKICAVVVTYYPDIEEAKRNILQYLDNVDHLIIWENTPAPQQAEHHIDLPQYTSKISYAGCGENKGISVALNYALKFASENGYTHLLTMDQDSYWENFKSYIDGVKEYSKPALFGPPVNMSPDKSLLTAQEYLITSGMIVPVEVCSKLGGYKEDFIVDGIDTDLCFRAHQANIQVVRINRGLLKQRFGEPQKAKFLGVTYHTPGYSPFRLHGIARNHLIILRKYKTSFTFKKEVIYKFFFMFPIKILLGENDKRQKLKAFARGVMEGITNKIK